MPEPFDITLGQPPGIPMVDDDQPLIIQTNWHTLPGPTPIPRVDANQYLEDIGGEYPTEPAWNNEDVYLATDCWPGLVKAIFYAGADTELGFVQSVLVQRVGLTWSTNNEPVLWNTPPLQGHPGGSMVMALPMPPRHDQQLYHVAVGDAVTVFTGKDGKSYFLSDELPFAAVVVNDGGGVTEDNCGGAGLATLKVRRQAITGTPASGASLADLQTAASADVEYTGVVPIAPTTTHHGYRCGDYVWVSRRGAYYFAESCRESFVAYLVTLGPAGEADFTVNHYWARELYNTVTYSTNTWTPVAGGIVAGDRTQTDPTGSGGRFGRWVDAANFGEAKANHNLAVVAEGGPTAATAVYVVVTMHTDPASGEVWYSFDHTLGRGTHVSPLALAPGVVASADVDEPQTDSWDRSNQGVNDGFTFAIQRTSFNDAGDEILHGQYRLATVDSNGAFSLVGAETGNEYVIDTPGSCPADTVSDEEVLMMMVHGVL